MEVSPDMEDRNQYTVGWIAALPLELAAAKAMLDEVHEKPLNFEQSSADKNSYIWGRIKGHCVVLASLAAGVYGTNSAATTAMQMLSSFPNIKIGLMVGIGAGIPRPDDGYDVRLGDIVVSQPDGRTGGVIQYDLGKAKAGHSFQHKGVLNMPPEYLLKALAKLQAEHESAPPRVYQHLQDVKEKNPYMMKSRPGRPGYAHPGGKFDRLFKASYLHSGKSCQECDAAEEVIREERDSEEPEIHYGIIASGNSLVKDAAVRDAIVKDTGENCICLEMEAAGLMNNFPCLVIRGVCDYADSHKNDRWQRYAAMTAATYAKEFLETIPSQDIDQAPKASELLKIMSQNVEEMNQETKKVSIAVQGIQSDQRHDKVTSWLAAPDPSVNLNKAIKQRHTDTGLWLLESETFNHWAATAFSFLWLHGIPGCGKTILSSTVINWLQHTTQPSPVLLYFFFDFNDSQKQEHIHMIRAMLSQIYSEQIHTRSYLDDAYKRHQQGLKQDSETLETILQTILGQFEEVSIVIDALDESKTRRDVLSWLQTIVIARPTRFHIIMTSRREEDIESVVTQFIIAEQIVPIQQAAVDKDIQSLVRHTLQNDHDLRRWQNLPVVQKEIEDKLMEKAKGMFRWVTCQLDALKDCYDYRSLLAALNSLPKTLDETYSRILEQIPTANVEKAIRILNLLTWFDTPLLLHEIVDAIAVHPSEQPAFKSEDRFPEERDVLRICTSLIVTAEGRREGSVELRLAHFSVKEYLTSNNMPLAFQEFLNEVPARTSIVGVCLSYLSSLDPNFTNSQLQNEYPFATSAARQWTVHASRVETMTGAALPVVLEFLEEQRQGFGRSCLMWHPELMENRSPGDTIPVLQYASACGLEYTVKYFIQKAVHGKIPRGGCGSALVGASGGGHRNIVKMLLDNRASLNMDIDARNLKGISAVYAASLSRHRDILAMLLENGAGTDAYNGNGTALMQAIVNREDKIVHMLLDNGADTNIFVGNVGSALVAAISRGSETLVKALIEKGANVNSGHFKTRPLVRAIRHGDEPIVELLLEQGADINGCDLLYGTPLMAASDSGHESVVENLVRNGADVNTRTEFDMTALITAARAGHRSIVGILLRNGADVSVRSRIWGTALENAMTRKHDDIVELLREHGAGTGTDVSE